MFLHYGAAGIAAASVAALLISQCGESRTQAPPPTDTCPAPRRCMRPDEIPRPVSAPVKGDEQCELDKGEHDPHSVAFDPASCGYCGDGQQNVWTVRRMENGQEKTVEVGRETAEACPVDFHCGNGTKELRPVTYGGIIMSNEGGAPSYSYGPIQISESCNSRESNYCADDCGGPARVPEGRGGGAGSARGEGSARGREPRVADSPPESVSTPCEGTIVQRLKRPFLNSLTAVRQQLQSAVGATPQQSVSASVQVVVRGGIPRATGSVSLSGPGSGSVSSGVVDLSSVSFTPDVNCSGTVSGTVSGSN